MALTMNSGLCPNPGMREGGINGPKVSYSQQIRLSFSVKCMLMFFFRYCYHECAQSHIDDDLHI